MKIPEKGYYYHYKHTQGSINNYAYEVLGVGRNTEENTYTVLYRPLYQNDWMKPADYQSRPLEMFMESVVKPASSAGRDGKTISRFTKITDKKIIAELEKIKREMYE